MRLFSLLISFVILFILFNSYKLNFQKSGIKILSIYGSRFSSSQNNCQIDGKSVTCQVMESAQDRCQSTINNCNPCWMKQYDYNTKKIDSEGYAVQLQKNSFHLVFFGVFKEYDANGKIWRVKKDSTIDISNVLLMKPDSIVQYLKTNNKILNSY